MNRIFRNTQKLLEKEMANVNATYNDLVKKVNNNSLPAAAAAPVLDGLVNRLGKLKRKVKMKKLRPGVVYMISSVYSL